jgi:hypothetical protein
MTSVEFEALKADIAERGVVVPIDVDEDGVILDGHHRFRAWIELKRNEPPPTIVRAGLSQQEKRAFARKNNILRRHLTREQVRQLVAEQLKDTPNWADNRIAAEFGVDGKTVGAVRTELEAISEIPKLDRLIGADGKERPAKQPRARRATPTGDEHIDGFRAAFGFKVSDFDALPTDIKLAMFEAGIPKSSFGGFIQLADPADDLSEAQIRGWQRFHAFLVERYDADPNGVADHIDWLLRQNFKTPEEWLGDEGDKYRKSCGMRPMKNEIREAWVKRDV